jgi:hydroxyacyl-ACP dehydratase HTD2-like protein with hotdog domain
MNEETTGVMEGSGLLILETVTPTETDLFMFSAATWLTHRIHYDREYALSEGFTDLVVHGPLQGAYLSQVLTAFAKANGGRLVRYQYRNVRPAYCSQGLTMSVAFKSSVEVDSELEVVVSLTNTNPQNEKVLVGEAALRVPKGAVLSEVGERR